MRYIVAFLLVKKKGTSYGSSPFTVFCESYMKVNDNVPLLFTYHCIKLLVYLTSSGVLFGFRSLSLSHITDFT